MRFAYWTENKQDWSTILERSRAAADSGWEAIWFADHLMPATGDRSGPVNECWAVLAGLAASIQGVRLGAMVSGNTYRNPAVLLKQAVTTDHIASGRVVLGLGAGWQENEHEAYGVHFGTVGERMARFEEACELIVRLRDEPDGVDFDGRHYTLSNAPLSPRPVGPLPLMIGGGGEKRTLRIAARFADEWNIWGEPDLMVHKQRILDGHCADVGRDPAAIQRSAGVVMVMADEGPYLEAARQAELGPARLVGTPDQVKAVVAEFVAAGVNELAIADWTFDGFEQPADMFDRFQAEVAPEFR